MLQLMRRVRDLNLNECYLLVYEQKYKNLSKINANNVREYIDKLSKINLTSLFNFDNTDIIHEKGVKLLKDYEINFNRDNPISYLKAVNNFYHHINYSNYKIRLFSVLKKEGYYFVSDIFDNDENDLVNEWKFLESIKQNYALKPNKTYVVFKTNLSNDIMKNILSIFRDYSKFFAGRLYDENDENIIKKQYISHILSNNFCQIMNPNLISDPTENLILERVKLALKILGFKYGPFDVMKKKINRESCISYMNDNKTRLKITKICKSTWVDTFDRGNLTKFLNDKIFDVFNVKMISTNGKHECYRLATPWQIIIEDAHMTVKSEYETLMAQQIYEGKFFYLKDKFTQFLPPIVTDYSFEKSYHVHHIYQVFEITNIYGWNKQLIDNKDNKSFLKKARLIYKANLSILNYEINRYDDFTTYEEHYDNFPIKIIKNNNYEHIISKNYNLKNKKSAGEVNFCEYLEENNILYQDEISINSLPNRRYDFLIQYNDRKYIVEIDGEQHFKYPNDFHKTKEEFIESQNIDILKAKIAIDNQFNMIRIDYKQIGNIDFHIKNAFALNEQIYYSSSELYQFMIVEL